MIDEIRAELEDRLRELISEADKLRRALDALGPDDVRARASRSRSGSPAATHTRSARRSRSRARSATPTNRAGRQGTRAANGASAQRGGSGQTKGAVLSVLQGGEAMTATEVAGATGLGRATVSTTLSRLTKTGDVSKAQRGYRIAQP